MVHMMSLYVVNIIGKGGVVYIQYQYVTASGHTASLHMYCTVAATLSACVVFG
jgi:hypothetical protein